MKPFILGNMTIKALDDYNMNIEVDPGEDHPGRINITHRQALDLISWLIEWTDPNIDPEEL